MVLQMKQTKWLREHNAKMDKLQTKLIKKGIEPNTLKTASIPFLDQKFYICPFCLNRSEPKNFIIQLPKGKIHHGLGKCPHCHNQVQWQTLMKVKEMTIEEFAYWCFDYALDGFWEKADYKSFNKNLTAMGLSKRFWDRYKELKGNNEVIKKILGQI